MTQKRFTLEEIPNIAKEIYSYILLNSHGEHATTVCFHGDLGAGKTTLIKELAKILGIKETEMTSPTFGIMHFHDIHEEHSVLFRKLIHVDAYRLDDPKEISVLGWTELINTQNNLIFIEWADKLGDYLPTDIINIYLQHSDKETERTIKF